MQPLQPHKPSIRAWGKFLEQNAAWNIENTVDIATTAIPTGIAFLRTAGYSAPGDGGGALYIPYSGTPSPARPWHKQSSDGAWWELAHGQAIHVEMFGATAFTAADLIAINGGAEATAAETANNIAFQAADAFVSANGGGTIFALRGIYPISVSFERSSSVYLDGGGVGEWEPVYSGRPKTWEGTTLLFRGTGVRNQTFAGITSMKNGGGWKGDPDSPGDYFKLWSAYNADASGTTAATFRQFSAAVLVKENVQYGGLRNLRICNWVGTDGISDWSNTSSASLGDEWDMGYVVRNGEYVDDFNVQVVGGWREADHALIVTTVSDSRAERNHFRKCKFNGARTLIRAPDRWSCTAPSSSTVQIYFSEESYWASGGGTFRGSDNVTYTYTGLNKVGTALTFTGVTPDPTGIFHIRHPSAGFANTEYEDCLFYGLDHVSGDRAADFGLTDSKALEISGYPLRAIKFRNCKFWTAEKVLLHLHDCQDFLFDNPQFEGSGHMIASPMASEVADPAQFWAPAAAQVGETRNLRMKADDTVGPDQRLFMPRGGVIDGRQFGPYSELNGHFRLKSLRPGRDTAIENWDASAFLRAYSNGVVGIRAGNADRMAFNTSGSIAPGADGTQNFGVTATRWLAGYFRSIVLGAAGTAFITSNAGAPEGVVTAPVGSLCLDYTNGVAYMKKTGTGNTGWKLVTQAA
jgi:hypothetical protein